MDMAMPAMDTMSTQTLSPSSPATATVPFCATSLPYISLRKPWSRRRPTLAGQRAPRTAQACRWRRTCTPRTRTGHAPPGHLEHPLAPPSSS